MPTPVETRPFGRRPAPGRPLARSVAALALVALALVAGCTPSRPSLGDAAGSGRAKVRGTVAVAGDSLTVGQLASLPPAAERAGIKLLVAAQVGRTTAQGHDDLRALLVDAVPVVPDLVVIALGTNDATADLTATAADEMIDATMAVIDPDVPVLWVSLYLDPSTPRGAAADRVNLALRRATSRHPNLTIADWHGEVTAHPDRMAADGVHLTDAGYVARTDWLVARMAARLPAA